MNYTERFVDLIVALKESSFPKEVIEHTKLLILDTIGCALGGYATKIGKQVVDMAKGFHGLGDATIIGDGAKVSMPFTCWANSSLANILDMDDVFAGTAHQANCLVPTALAVGEMKKKSGLEVIQAIVAGFEVGSRVMMYSWPSPSMARTYFPSAWQVFNAVTVSGMLLDFDKNQFYHGFGLAGTVPPLPIDMQKFVERPMGFSKNVFGWTTLTGVFWAMMAQRGAEGTVRIFDGEAGFWKIMGSDHRDFEKLIEGFGERYDILQTKYKPYPLCTWGHTSADAAKKIFDENDIDCEAIEAVTVRTLKRVVDFVANAEIKTIFDAQLSLPHAISMLALGEKPGLAWMSEENIFRNKKAKSIAEKVRIEIDESAEDIFDKEKGLAVPSEVTVILKDGRTFRESVKYSKGTSKNPFTVEELKAKFSILAEPILGKKRTKRIAEVVGNLEQLNNISELTELLRCE